MKTFEVVCKEVAEFTDSKHHCKARLEIAKFIGSKRFIEFYSKMVEKEALIPDQHKKNGSTIGKLFGMVIMESTFYQSIEASLGKVKLELLVSKLDSNLLK